jgi:outer membrane receptor protein involved in Fe transport
MNFKILKFCISLLLMMCNISVFAQTRTIKGTVKDEQGTEIIGATVSVPGTKVAAVTDLDGNFSVDVPESATKLKINYIGYSDQIINISNRTSVSCVLKEDTRILNEVVSIGYAKVRRKDLTGAISSIEGKELENTPVATAAQALEGKIPGVNIISTSGAPGAGSTITVRGGMSLTQSSTPLYIVDGFEMDNALDNIDINDIESIDVLKDASSTAIYGARILILTILKVLMF